MGVVDISAGLRPDNKQSGMKRALIQELQDIINEEKELVAHDRSPRKSSLQLKAYGNAGKIACLQLSGNALSLHKWKSHKAKLRLSIMSARYDTDNEEDVKVSGSEHRPQLIGVPEVGVDPNQVNAVYYSRQMTNYARHARKLKTCTNAHYLQKKWAKKPNSEDKLPQEVMARSKDLGLDSYLETVLQSQAKNQVIYGIKNADIERLDDEDFLLQFEIQKQREQAKLVHLAEQAHLAFKPRLLPRTPQSLRRSLQPKYSLLLNPTKA